MNHLIKACDEVIAAREKATPGPWEHGEGVCGPYLDFREHARDPETGYDGRSPVWLGGDVAPVDRECIALAVNHAATFAAVVKAAAERPWRHNATRDDGISEYRYCAVCGMESDGDEGPFLHADACEMRDLDAALDAAEKAAAKGGA